MDKEIQDKASYKERLEEIIELSYKLFCNKVAEEMIAIPNEASFQLHLGVVMKMVGQLYEFNPEDRFVINLETVKEIGATTKSASGKARCDIELALYHQGICEAKALIELKHFRKDKNEAVTDNRFSLFKDLENLEKYSRAEDSTPICCAMVFTDNKNYTDSGTSSKINIGNEVTSPQEIVYTGDKVIRLKNQHTFHWDSFSDKCHFLKIIF